MGNHSCLALICNSCKYEWNCTIPIRSDISKPKPNIPHLENNSIPVQVPQIHNIWDFLGVWPVLPFSRAVLPLGKRFCTLSGSTACLSGRCRFGLKTKSGHLGVTIPSFHPIHPTAAAWDPTRGCHRRRLSSRPRADLLRGKASLPSPSPWHPVFPLPLPL